MARFRMTAVAFALVLVAAFAVAEAWRPPVPPAGGGVLEVQLASSLRAFSDCDAFLDTVRGEALNQVSAWGLGGGMGYGYDMGGIALRDGVTAGGAGGAESLAAGADGDSFDVAEENAFAPQPAMPEAEGSGVVKVSGTNVQEQGVDEPDVVKTDGRVLASVARGRLQLVDLRDGAGRLAATLPLSGGWGHELLLHDGRLLITANVEEQIAGSDQPVSSDQLRGQEEDATTEMRIAPDAMPGAPGIGLIHPGTPKVELTLLDVSDPADPRTLGSVRLDGQLVSSRRVDGMVRLVMRSHPQPAMATPQPGAATDEATMRRLEREAVDANREIIQTSQASDWLPTYTVRDAEGGTVEEAPLVDCTAIRYPEQFRGFGMLSVLAIPMAGEQAGALVPTGAASVLGDGDTVYATPDRLYVAMNRWEQVGAPQPLIDPAVGAPLIDPAVGAPMPVEPDGGIGGSVEPAPAEAEEEPIPVEPDGGIGGGAAPEPGPEPKPVPEPEPAPGSIRPDVMPAAPTATVDIHEFDTTDPSHPVYSASVNVPGQILNSWALSFHDGHLRVATTTEQFAADGTVNSQSSVYVLRRDGAQLVEVGRVDGLGKGERIYAVRWFGDYGFVVTFRQTDPLYALDLSDPTAPRVVGELKVPGYSAYLHPVGDGLLLGVGQDADERDGRRLGVQVSLFDVSDLSSPRRVANLTTEPDSSTEVEHEHRAFLWWPAAKRAVLPYMHARWDEATQRDAGFFGALALEVDGDVREAGRLTHFRDGDLDPWWSQIRRAVVVGDTLWTMSERGLLASDVDDLAERAFLEFDGPTPQRQQFDRGFAEGGAASSESRIVD